MSSFRKRNVQKRITGTCTSLHTGQVITSSGNPSMDVVLGGGLPVGSICLIEEDKHVTNAKVLAKYFVAEGIVSTHDIFLGSLDDDPAELLRKLPHPLTDEQTEQERQVEEAEGDDEASGLRIAWRYNDIPLVNSEQSAQKLGHHFDLTTQMDPVLFFYAKTSLWDDTTETTDAAVDDEDAEGENRANGQQDTSASTTTSSESSTTSTSSITSDKDSEITSSSSSDTKMYATVVNTDALMMHDYTAPMPMPTSTSTSTPMNIDQIMEPLEMLMDHTVDNVAPTMPIDIPSIASTTNTAAIPDGDELTPSSSSISQVANASVKTQTSPPQSSTVSSPSSTSRHFTNVRYERLLTELQLQLKDDRYTIGMNSRKELCRVCITSLGSPLWYEENFAKDLLKFLTILRALISSATAVCMITMPMHLIAKHDATLVPKIRNLVDYAIELDSFAGTDRETHAVYKDYTGLLHLRKVTAINTLTAYQPETSDLAFKLRRKKFVIQKLHLPPDTEEAKDAEAKIGDNTTKATTPPQKMLSCASNADGSLDF